MSYARVKYKGHTFMIDKFKSYDYYVYVTYIYLNGRLNKYGPNFYDLNSCIANIKRSFNVHF